MAREKYVPVSETWEPDELDLAILRVLPDEGEMVGKYLPRGVYIKELPKLVDTAVPVNVYIGRVRSMVIVGVAVKRKGSGEGFLWQRTERGRDLVLGKKLKVVGE